MNTPREDKREKESCGRVYNNVGADVQTDHWDKRVIIGHIEECIVRDTTVQVSGKTAGWLSGRRQASINICRI